MKIENVKLQQILSSTVISIMYVYFTQLYLITSTFRDNIFKK